MKRGILGKIKFNFINFINIRMIKCKLFLICVGELVFLIIIFDNFLDFFRINCVCNGCCFGRGFINLLIKLVSRGDI